MRKDKNPAAVALGKKTWEVRKKKLGSKKARAHMKALRARQLAKANIA